jgi:hypothetical protein
MVPKPGDVFDAASYKSLHDLTRHKYPIYRMGGVQFSTILVYKILFIFRPLRTCGAQRLEGAFTNSIRAGSAVDPVKVRLNTI